MIVTRFILFQSSSDPGPNGPFQLTDDCYYDDDDLTGAYSTRRRPRDLQPLLFQVNLRRWRYMEVAIAWLATEHKPSCLTRGDLQGFLSVSPSSRSSAQAPRIYAFATWCIEEVVSTARYRQLPAS